MKGIEKNKEDEWMLLIQILSGEKQPDDPDFVEWLESKENRDLYEYLKSDSTEVGQWDKEAIFDKISDSIGLNFTDKKVKLIRAIAVAASIAIILAGSIFIWFSNFEVQENSFAETDNGEFNIIDKQKAILTLDTGKTIELSSNFTETKSGNTLLTNESSGILRYIKEDTLLPPTIHVLEVPYGGEYKLVLSDGTKVYLNSGTKIKYPNYFADNQRSIELEGEAYFDVVKNDKPFIVHTENIDIKVLGTTFNVKAYKDERYVNTTLVEGKVKVKTNRNNKEYIMVPDYNLNYDTQTYKVLNEKVDTNLYTAWIRGQFVFRNQKMEDITSQLARWYDVKIDYDNDNLKGLRFTGSVDKNKDIDYVLRQMKEITNIKYKRNEEVIIIYN